MSTLADIVLSPRGGIVAWQVVGLAAGWLAGRVMKGRGYGIGVNLVLGLIGAAVGGFLFGLFVSGGAGFWGSIVVAFLGACILITVVRFLGIGRARF
jgi:uncharacterized membrane protein YeaQ/YmgE (transglycosylase-associated protein family)